MLLSEKIKNDIKTAMKERRKDVVGALRMLHASIKNQVIALKRELTDDEVIRLLQTGVKQRKEAVTQYRAGGRDELADQEQMEIDLFETYLPQQLDKTELAGLVDAAIAETGAVSMKDIGAVMKKVLAASAGRADGAMVNGLVRARLA